METTAKIRQLSSETPYALGAALKRQKDKKTKRQKKKKNYKKKKKK